MKIRTLFVFALAATAGIAASAQSPSLATEGAAWWSHVQYLADDALEGRNVGTPGFEKAVQYVESQYQKIGLKPAGNNGYRQTVELDSRTLVAEDTKLALVRDGKEEPLAVGQDATLNARGELNGTIDAPMVFVGYGLSIPEAGWDDFAGLNLKGKVAVYVNAFPPVKVSDNVRSHVNSADERWVALKRAGAIGVATIAAPRAGGAGNRGGAAPGASPTPSPTPTPTPTASTSPTPSPTPAAGAGRGAAGGTGRGGPAPVIAIYERDVNPEAGQVIAMSLTARGAGAIFGGTGHTLTEMNELVTAQKPLPRFDLPVTLRAKATLKRDVIPSANVVGMIEGSDPVLKNEYVIMSAHLDHTGVGRAINGDAIFNGAMDDASGVASLIETARLLKTSGVQIKRSVLFVAVTAEEKGLLGSLYFASRPTVPFKQIVADINLDMFLPLYPLKFLEVQGLTESSLGETVRAAAKSQGVEVQTDREPEQNRFIRSDQYSFIQKGVPALAFKFGYEFGSPEETIRKNWVRDVYHKVNDDVSQPVDKEAAALFNRVIMTLLQNVANETARPKWNEESFFKRFAR